MTKSIALAGVAALALAACSPSEDDTAYTDSAEVKTETASGDMTPASVDVVEAASANGNLGTFLQAATSAGVAETLANADGITIFAPIDEAFGEVENLDQLQQNPDQMAALLQRHAVSSTYMSSAIPQGETELQTLSGETLTIENSDGQIMVIGPGGTRARVVEADIDGENGVVHAINAVLTRLNAAAPAVACVTFG